MTGWARVGGLGRHEGSCSLLVGPDDWDKRDGAGSEGVRAPRAKDGGGGGGGGDGRGRRARSRARARARGEGRGATGDWRPATAGWSPTRSNTINNLCFSPVPYLVAARVPHGECGQTMGPDNVERGQEGLVAGKRLNARGSSRPLRAKRGFDGQRLCVSHAIARLRPLTAFILSLGPGRGPASFLSYLWPEALIGFHLICLPEASISFRIISYFRSSAYGSPGLYLAHWRHSSRGLLAVPIKAGSCLLLHVAIASVKIKAMAAHEPSVSITVW